MPDLPVGPPRIVPTHRAADVFVAAGLAFICTALARDYLNADQLSGVHASLVGLRGGDGPNAYRFLTFLVPQLLFKNGVSLVQSYMLVHAATLAAAYYAFLRALRERRAPDAQATPVAATVALAALYCLGLEPGVIQPADSWTLLSVALLFRASTARRLSLAALAGALALAALSKENAFYYAPYVLWRLAQGAGRREFLARAALVFGPGVALWLALRLLVPMEADIQRQWLPNFWITLGALRDLPWLLIKDDFFSSVSRAGSLHWLIAFFPFLAWALTRDWRSMDRERVWIARSLPAPIALNLLLGVSAEFRIFTDAFIWLLPLVTGERVARASAQQIRGNLLHGVAGAAVGISLLFGADAALGPNGFWNAEFDGTRRFRWFDRSAREILTLPRDAQAGLYLPLKISGAGLGPGETRTVRVALRQGERSVDLETQVGEEWMFLRVPAAEFSPGPLEATLSSQFYFIPAAMRGSSADRRILSAQLGDATTEPPGL